MVNYGVKDLSKNNYKKIDTVSIILGIMMILTALTGVVDQTVLSFLIILCCCFLVALDKLYLAFPFMMFYYSFYGLFLGVSVYRIYTLLLLFSSLLRVTQKSSIKRIYIPTFFVYFLFAVGVMLPIEGGTALYIVIDIICCYILVSKIDDDETINSFFSVYVIVSLISYITGCVFGNYVQGESALYSRFMATFEDPNYMGLFFTVNVFAVATLKLFTRNIRVILIVVLYSMIITSLSITAIIINLIMWFFYLIIMRQLKTKHLFLIAVSVILLVFLYNYGLNNPDSGVLGDLVSRLSDKNSELNSGDLGGATTGRTDLAIEHLKYFASLPIINKLFGGIPVNVKYIHPDFELAAHNEYVDMLLNVGVVGFVIMFGVFVYRIVLNFKKYNITQRRADLFFVIVKSIWACYAMSLTMFLDYRFTFLFLL